MLITPLEILYFIILVAVVGFIFMGLFVRRPKTVYDMMHPKKFDFRDFKFAALVAAPGIVLHELAHKFVAMGFGYSATFTIWPIGLIIGIILKLIGSPFILLAPGYVQIPMITDAVIYRLIAFAGPAVNLILWIVSIIVLKNVVNMSRKQVAFWSLTKTINMILFFFNMIPFGPLDGAKVLFGPQF